MTAEKTRAWLDVSASFIRERLMLPDQWDVVGVEWDVSTQAMRVIVEGDNVPQGHRGELLGEITRHDGGEFVRWKPAAPPPPPTFMRIAGTTTCWWCKRDEAEHGPDRLCPKRGNK